MERRTYGTRCLTPWLLELRRRRPSILRLWKFLLSISVPEPSDVHNTPHCPPNLRRSLPPRICRSLQTYNWTLRSPDPSLNSSLSTVRQLHRRRRTSCLSILHFLPIIISTHSSPRPNPASRMWRTPSPSLILIRPRSLELPNPNQSQDASSLSSSRQFRRLLGCV